MTKNTPNHENENTPGAIKRFYRHVVIKLEPITPTADTAFTITCTLGAVATVWAVIVFAPAAVALAAVGVKVVTDKIRS